MAKHALPFIEKCFATFQVEHAKLNMGAACDAFEQALWADPRIAYRYFLCRASGPMAQSMHHTRRSGEFCAWLDKLLADNPDMHLLVDWDPDLIRRIVELREENIARGMPSIVHVTQGKAASIPVANIFNSGYNLPSFAYSLSTVEVIESWARDYARGGACYSTHLDPRPVNIRRLKHAGASKVIVHVRDPRQSILSLVHHVSRYSDQLVSLAQSGFENRSISEQLNDVLEFYVSRIAWIQGWLNAEDELDIHFSTFESFVRDRKAFTQQYIDFYGGHEEHFSWQNAMRAHAGVDQHFRAGRIDEWRETFPSKQAALLTALIPEEMRERFRWPA